MTDNKQLNTCLDRIRRENARVGYQVALDLWISQTGVCWDRVNSAIVTNSIFVGVIGLAISNLRPIALLVRILSLAAVALNLCWLHLLQRGFNRGKYYMRSARELEEQYLSDPIKTVGKRGDLNAMGKRVTLVIDGKSKELEGSWFGWLKSEYASYVIITVFLALYVLILMGEALGWFRVDC